MCGKACGTLCVRVRVWRIVRQSACAMPHVTMVLKPGECSGPRAPCHTGLAPGKGYVDVSTIDAATAQVRPAFGQHALGAAYCCSNALLQLQALPLLLLLPLLLQATAGARRTHATHMHPWGARGPCAAGCRAGAQHGGRVPGGAGGGQQEAGGGRRTDLHGSRWVAGAVGAGDGCWWRWEAHHRFISIMAVAVVVAVTVGYGGYVKWPFEMGLT